MKRRVLADARLTIPAMTDAHTNTPAMTNANTNTPAMTDAHTKTPAQWQTQALTFHFPHIGRDAEVLKYFPIRADVGNIVPDK